MKGDIYAAMVLALMLASSVLAPPVYANDPKAVHYRGEISAERNRRFLAALGSRSVERLIITSAGGAVEAGIRLGRWVYQQGLDVEVREYCLSSCANYVFPAGRRKTIRPGAVVAWHGNYHHLAATGLWRDDVLRRIEHHGEDPAVAEREVRRQVRQLVGMERAFFAHIGVNQYLCWIGKMPPYNVPNYYFLSKRDMRRFGITNVQTPPDYVHSETSEFNVSIEYIDLEGP